MDAVAHHSYSSAAKWLHWLTAAAVLFAIPAGVTMSNLKPGPLQDRLYDLHRSTGALILALAAIRILVRVLGGAPEPHPSLPRWQRTVSVLVHKSLYVLIVLVPLLGWAATSAYGAPIVVYGLFELPPLLSKSESVSKILFTLHKTFALVLAAMVVVHIGAGLWHGVVKRDGVLARMLPGRVA